MAWRLRLAPEYTSFDFFKYQWLTFGGSMLLMVLSFVAWGVMGLNYGIDFKGGTTLRTDSSTVIDTARYRSTLDGLKLGDVAINEVFDPSFRADQHVAAIRLSAPKGAEQIDDAAMKRVQTALTAMDPNLKIVSVETVGPKVSSELVWSSIKALAFTLSRRSPQFVGQLPDHALLSILQTAKGGFGTSMDYLLETANSLRNCGIRDREIERLVALVRSDSVCN